MLRFLGSLVALLLLMAILGAGGVLFTFYYYGRDLPDYKQLAVYDPPTVTRVHAGDGRLLAEYAIEKRVYVPITAMPGRVVNAFLAAEDKNFYLHPGVDILSVFRAIVTNLANLGENRRPVGASTITQQVAKNFLLTNEVSIERKIKEAILAFRIEHAFTKDRILDLYLNEIYLGSGVYGVAAAALHYFNKSLDELAIAEAAYLAALPKAPNNYHPIRRPEAALARRNWVIGRMLEDGRISLNEAEAAWAQPFEIEFSDPTDTVKADYFVEEVRRELAEVYGESGLYEGGLSVRTTLDPWMQDLAERALRDGLMAYDRRHGWRGPVATLDPASEAWRTRLAGVRQPPGTAAWRLAMVTGVEKTQAEIGFANGGSGRIPFAEMKWARPWLKDQRVGRAPRRAGDVVAVGDVVLVEAVEADEKGNAYEGAAFALRQVPDVNGALVAIDPHTGRVLAMSGGFSFKESEYNRATQAYRQPGSAFKPFVYLAAMDHGFTPATIVLDAPMVIDQGAGLGKWKPSNYSNKFYGPTPLRLGLERSRNLMTVRLAQEVGMDNIVEYSRKFGIDESMRPLLSMALGAGETTLLKLTTGYAMLVNGGKKITPTLIDRVQDRRGKTVYRHDGRACTECQAPAPGEGGMPELPDVREQIADPRSVYQVVSMLQGVVERGTGRRIRSVGKPLAGKTGTTNDSADTWFLGFTPDLAVGVFVGFDEPRTLGPKETGSSVAAPIFRDFMAEALEGKPAIPFRIPPGLRLVRLNVETGQLARFGDDNVILEAFKPGTVPDRRRQPVIGAPADSGRQPPTVIDLGRGTGGLY